MTEVLTYEYKNLFGFWHKVYLSLSQSDTFTVSYNETRCVKPSTGYHGKHYNIRCPQQKQDLTKERKKNISILS